MTAISRPLEVELYKAVDESPSAASIKGTSGAAVASLPWWAMVGAELQDPKTGQILAEYPGKGQEMTAAQCKAAECDINTAVYARAQAGSAFKPYVLATAVSEGLNVKTSTLNASPELCIPPDTKPTAPSQVVPYGTTKCAQPDYFPVYNDGGQVIGTPGTARGPGRSRSRSRGAARDCARLRAPRGYARASSADSVSRPSGPRLRAAVCQRLRSKPGRR